MGKRGEEKILLLDAVVEKGRGKGGEKGGGGRGGTSLILKDVLGEEEG